MESKDTPAHDKNELKIDSPEINVSNRRNKSFYIFLGKKILEKFGTLTLNALGNATTNALEAANSLEKNDYAEITSLQTCTVSVEQTRNKKDENKQVNRAKLVIVLKKSKGFEENMKKFEQIRAENQKLAQ